DAIVADLAASNGNAAARHAPEEPDGEAVEALLRERQPRLVSYEGWEAIDRHERARGEASGRPRVKVTSIEEMLRIAADEQP
ncbi:MAG TPA: NADP oxidoreductase, partial [Solirubrobacteraceae bacterium]